MRGSRCTVLGFLITATAGGCQAIAGIEDLHLTGGALDASMTDASDAAVLTDSSADGDGLARDGTVDAPSDARRDAPHDSSPPTDAGEAGITYAQEVLLDHPLAYWRFDDKSGTTAVDSSGNGNNGTYVGGVTLGAQGAIVDDPGTSVTFDGLTAWMTAGDLFAFVGTAPCSFEAWVNPVVDTDYHNILSRSDGQGNATVGYLMYIEPQDAAYIDFAHYNSASMTDIAESNTVIATGVFTHLVGVYDGSNIYIYGNGVLLDEIPTTFPTPTTTNPFIVGAQSGGTTAWFSGQIDEVAVYGSALSAARILAHYHVGMGLAP
jgi:hypothetical protein